jgi:drug/metabolite transporter (DMT)-like permease
MKMKLVAGLAFLLNSILFATYYAVSKEALGRIDPIVFSFFEMISLVPAALCIIVLSWKDINKVVVKRGVLLGSWLCLALFTIAIALKYTSATSTAFFPSLNGFLAALIAWFFLRRPVKKLTWLAGLLSVVGTVMLVMNLPTGNWRGSLIAFLGGVFFTCYVFLADHQQVDESAPWALFGIELLTMALWANLVVLLFGDWRAVQPSLPHDLWVVLYVAGACTFLPVLITVLMQKHLSPVTVSFIYILEPILAAVAANIYLHEVLPIQAYVGGALVVVGAIIHTYGVARQSTKERSEAIQEQSSASWTSQMLVGLVSVPHSMGKLLSAQEMPEWYIESHRQVGTVPYSISRKGEKTLLQRRRRDRLPRLGIMEFVE